ncbi:MAG: DUF3634 family protein [Isosphaeraceae bacterium]
MRPLIGVTLLGVVGFAIWRACAPRAAFVIRLRSGEPHVVRGRVTTSFLAEVRDLCRHHGVARGSIRGLPRDGRIALDLRGPFPPAFRQQLRNVWAITGWSAGRPRDRNSGGTGLV